ncbi:hypothetical protein EAH87_06165 [Sphingomonas koreensis]|nr:hypothetical protein EAH87_06165 [Sphingomonas koreensis]
MGAGGFGTPLGFKGEGLGRPVVKLPGHVVHEVNGVNFSHRKGYLLLKTRSVTNGETETVVDFGSVYVGGSAVTGGASDRSFFHRFVFGARAKAVCGGSTAQ